MFCGRCPVRRKMTLQSQSRQKQSFSTSDLRSRRLKTRVTDSTWKTRFRSPSRSQSQHAVRGCAAIGQQGCYCRPRWRPHSASLQRQVGRNLDILQGAMPQAIAWDGRSRWISHWRSASHDGLWFGCGIHVGRCGRVGPRGQHLVRMSPLIVQCCSARNYSAGARTSWRWCGAE